MHMSEWYESLRSRRIVDFNRHSSSSGEEEAAAEDKSSEQDSDRGGHTAPGFFRSRELQSGQNRRPIERVYSQSTFALPLIARGTAAAHTVTIPETRKRRA